mgnify:CR=1 FL=1|tara:strand:+ start:5243 stop:5503 length:261 start_codon:yes stop_codon:yes gene_type:complete
MPGKQKKTVTPGFEDTMNTLSEIVKGLEDGDLSLEDSLKAFEQGIGLTREAQKSLTDAEQKVALLLDQDGSPEPGVFHPEDDDAEP